MGRSIIRIEVIDGTVGRIIDLPKGIEPGEEVTTQIKFRIILAKCGLLLAVPVGVWCEDHGKMLSLKVLKHKR